MKNSLNSVSICLKVIDTRRHGSVSPEAVDAKYPISKPRLWLPSLLTPVMVTLRGAYSSVGRAPSKRTGGHSQENPLESNSCSGRVAQLGEHLLCKHAFISPKSLNRRLFTVQTPLQVGLLNGLQTRIRVRCPSLDEHSE